MAEVGISEAMALTGKSSATIYRWVDSGKLACTLSEDGKRKFDTAELARVFSLVKDAEADIEEKMLVEELRARIADLQRTVDDYRERERKMQAMLDSQAETIRIMTGRVLPEGGGKKGFWARLFG